MPATTPLGVPYPLGTDRVSDGDNAIQALAEWVDRSLCFGAAQSQATGPGANASMWFNTWTNVHLTGGMAFTTDLANGSYFTVPRNGWYSVHAVGGISFGTSGAAGNSRLFVGDRSNAWVNGYVEMWNGSDANVARSCSALAVVLLAAGSLVAWGMANSGASAGGMSVHNQLLVRLLLPT